ncbi:MAG: alpha/beta hydrolase [Bacteroidales bacterium]|nr:alpha/beta hydrolase [Bacteroidales bacterium]
MMKKNICLVMICLLAVSCNPFQKKGIEAPQWLEGDWSGVIEGVGLAFSIHFGEECYATSPDQGDIKLNVKIKSLTDKKIKVRVPLVMASYEGTIHEDSIEGQFSQMGKKFPLNLQRGWVERKRPQNPQPPFPYQTKEVVFESGDHTLAGTLSLPDGIENPPVVLFVSGSGPQNRDEELLGHKPFAVIADALAREGIASLRYDDRGIAESTGDFSAATTADLADDAAAGIHYLYELGFNKVGVVGHSEGGTIAFLLAGDPLWANNRPDFIVSLAGMAERGDSTLVHQSRLQLQLTGVPKAAIGLMVKSTLKKTKKVKPWGPYFLNLDPSTAIAAIQCPVLALNGGKDTQVIPEYNLELIRQLLPAADTRLYPDLNHLFQHCDTGLPTQYATIEETFAPEVLADIIAWIQAR